MIRYDSKLRAYTDGRYLYMSARGIKRSLEYGGWACVAWLDSVGGPDIVANHWGGFAGEQPMQLYRRHRVRGWSPYNDYWKAGRLPPVEQTRDGEEMREAA